MSWFSRITNVLRSSGLNRHLDEEIAFHIESRVAELVAGGMTRDAAERTARRQFGNPLLIRERSRDVKLASWLDSFVRDVRLGVRMLRKHPLVTMAAIVSLALAIGACAAVFSIVDALILRPLPVHQPDRLIYLTYPDPNFAKPDRDTFSDPAFVRLRDAGREQADLFAVGYPTKPRVTFGETSGERETVRSQFVSGDVFERLGIVPATGRLLSKEDDLTPGAHPVAVLSHAFWMRRFGGDPSIIGRSLIVYDRPSGLQLQIIGVTEPSFNGLEPGHATDVWIPYAMQALSTFGNSGYRTLRIFGRLKDGVTAAQAHGPLGAAFANFRRDDVANNVPPGAPLDEVARFVDAPLHVRPAATGPSPVRARFEQPLWILGGIAALTLLIAGSNVVNVFLMQMAAREGEMSLRLALGAWKGRMIQQTLVEGGIVASLACTIGAMFAMVAAPWLVTVFGSVDDAVVLDLRADWRFIAFISAVTLASTALLGLVPAWRASSADPMSALSASSRRTSGRGWVMRPFIVMQVAFSLVVLFVGGLLVRSFVKLAHVDPGFAISDVMLVSWEAIPGVEPQRQRDALLQALDRIREVPGVAAVSAAEFGALGRAWRNYIPVPGTAGERIEVTMAPVTPGYFETMRIPLLAGRSFVRRDLDAAEPTVVVVNESFAKRYFGNEAAVGRAFDAQFGRQLVPNEVVGVVSDVRYDLRQPPAPTIYILLPLDRFQTLHVRVTGVPGAIAARLREEVRAATPLVHVTSITSQAAVVDREMVRERLLAVLAGFFALVGLVLTAVGLYGTLSYAVVQRTREIGIRVALGAPTVGAVQPVLLDGAGMVLLGTACGLAGGLYASRFVQAILFDVAPLEVSSLGLPLGTLLVTALLAAAVPAWRAARIDPVVALRNE